MSVTAESYISEFYDQWDEDEYWEECPACRGTGMDRDEIYDCEECGGEGEIRIYDHKNITEISVPQPLTDTEPI